MAGFGQRLCSAAEAGDVLVVRKLLRRLPHIDVNSRGHEMYGQTALSKAAKSSLLSIFNVCLLFYSSFLYPCLLQIHFAYIG